MNRVTVLRRNSVLSRLPAVLLTATALTGVAAPALAQDLYWSGKNSQNWSDTGNWYGFTLPDGTYNTYVNLGNSDALITGGFEAQTGNLYVGFDAEEGALTIEDGSLKSYTATIGKDGGTGTLTVTGADSSFEVDTSITLGAVGTGTLQILDGASVTSNQGILGDSLGSVGTVTIDGDGSNWTAILPEPSPGMGAGPSMFIGYGGEGELTVQNGGSVNTHGTYLGYWSGAEGTLTVTGDGTTYTDEGDLMVGFFGKGTLDISDGAQVEVQQSLYVNDGTVTVAGEDTTLDIWGGLSLTGEGATVTLSDGATITSESGYVDAAGETAPSVTVTGQGTTWTVEDDISVALENKGSLTVADGAVVSAARLTLASRENAIGDLTVSSGGKLTVDSVMVAGEEGARAEIRLESDGILETAQVRVGDGGGGVKGTGTVTFDGGILRLTADQYYLFADFTQGDIVLEDGGGTIDTGDFEVMTDYGFTGVGGLTKDGDGGLYFFTPGANTYEGVTHIRAGRFYAAAADVLSAASTHDIAAGAELSMESGFTFTPVDQTIGGLSGAGKVVLGDSSLTVGGNDDSTTFSGEISGKGGLTKTGSGTLTLTGANVYSGQTTIESGILSVNNSMASAVTVKDGGTLGGSGSLGFIHVEDGGTLAPGNSIGTLRAANLTLDGGSILDVELNSGGNVAGTNNDLAEVSARAEIRDGATIRVRAANGTDTGKTYTPGLTYQVISVTGLHPYITDKGLFVATAPTIVDDFAYLDFTGSSDEWSYYLTSNLVATSFCLDNSTANQCRTGDALFDLGSGNAGFDLFQGLSETDAPKALDAISGEAHASMQHVIDESFAAIDQALQRRTAAGLTGSGQQQSPNGYAAAPGNVGVLAIDDATASGTAQAWITALGSRGSIGGNGNAAGIGWTTGGLALGYEDSVALGSGSAFGGVALAYQRGAGSVADRATESQFDTFALSTYGGWTDGASSLSGTLTVGTGHVATDRTIVVGGTTEVAHADYWTQAAHVALEASHAIDLGNGTRVSPLATFAAGWQGHAGFTETGAGAFNLGTGPSGALTATAGIGLAVAQDIAMEDGTLTLDGRAVYERSLAGADSSQSFTFAGGAAPFTVSGVTADTDRLSIGAGLAFTLTDGLTIAASYDGRISANAQSHQATASVGSTF